MGNRSIYLGKTEPRAEFVGVHVGAVEGGRWL